MESAPNGHSVRLGFQMAQSFALLHQLILHRLLDCSRIAALQGGKNAQVFFERLQQAAWCIELLQVRELEDCAQITHGHGRPFMTRHGDGGFVDQVVDGVVVLNLPTNRIRFQLCMQVGHDLHVGIVGMSGIFMGAATLRQGLDRLLILLNKSGLLNTRRIGQAMNCVLGPWAR